jgi:predicted glycoside hydrolase/deacetylase ChbG (UPF0249 family)
MVGLEIVPGEPGLAAEAAGISPKAPADARFLIVNADDFGRTDAINTGVIRAHEHGIVTSASLMVRYQTAPAAAAYARDRPVLSLGLHVDLHEWEYDGREWRRVYEVVSVDDGPAVADEVERQLETFRELVEREPTHLDSHQHVHMWEPGVQVVLSECADHLGLPLRRVTKEIQHSGQFYGQTRHGEAVEGAISVESLSGILRALAPGVTELGCHPAEGTDVESTYRAERQRELDVLCDPRIRAVIDEEGIVLRSFNDSQP